MNKILKATYPLVAMLGLTAALLTACTGDSDDAAVGANRQVCFVSATRQFDDGNDTTAGNVAGVSPFTRTVTMPSEEWVGYRTLYPDSIHNMLMFIAKEGNNPTSSDVSSRLFRFTGDNNDWRANITITNPDAKYKLFGFLPMDVDNSSDHASIQALSPIGGGSPNYANGAQLTINGLKVLTSLDPCVIVGVATAETRESDVTLEWGKFDFQFKPNSDATEVTDYGFMLLDHLYSRFYFQLRVDADYAKIRTIRVKKMTLDALAGDGVTPLRSVDATVVLRPNITNSNPISSITFTPNTGERTFLLYDKKDTDGTTLTTSYAQIGTFCLAPYNQQWFRLTTEYDVIDTSGAVIRQDEAVNSFNTSAFTGDKITGIKPGVENCIQITVRPTFLYTLTDSDIEFRFDN